MATDGVTRRCFFLRCGLDFEPRDRRQRYCNDLCQYAAAHERQRPRTCRNCAQLVPAGSEHRRFDSAACKQSYFQKRRAAAKRVTEVRPTIAVLVPLGCNPKRAPQVEDPEEIGRHRNLTCRQYERCLTSAAVKGWGGFTCRFCDMASQK